jgi:hypothetical protein
MATVVPAARRDILRMEFKRFLGSFIQIPCQIVATGSPFLGSYPQIE